MNAIGKRAERNAQSFQAERAIEAKKYLKALEGDMGEYTKLSILLVGQFGGAISGLASGLEFAKTVDNVPCRVVAGAVVGLGGVLVGTGPSIILMPAGPYLWYKSSISSIYAKI